MESALHALTHFLLGNGIKKSRCYFFFLLHFISLITLSCLFSLSSFGHRSWKAVMKVKVSKKGNRKENTSWASVQHTTKKYKPTSATSVLESRTIYFRLSTRYRKRFYYLSPSTTRVSVVGRHFLQIYFKCAAFTNCNCSYTKKLQCVKSGYFNPCKPLQKWLSVLSTVCHCKYY